MLEKPEQPEQAFKMGRFCGQILACFQPASMTHYRKIDCRGSRLNICGILIRKWMKFRKRQCPFNNCALTVNCEHWYTENIGKNSHICICVCVCVCVHPTKWFPCCRCPFINCWVEYDEKGDLVCGKGSIYCVVIYMALLY